ARALSDGRIGRINGILRWHRQHAPQPPRQRLRLAHGSCGAPRAPRRPRPGARRCMALADARQAPQEGPGATASGRATGKAGGRENSLQFKTVFETVKQLKAEGTAVFVIEQNVRAALTVADRVYVLSTGNIVAEGTPSEIVGHLNTR